MSEEKSTVSLGKQLEILTTRYIENEDLTVHTHWHAYAVYQIVLNHICL